MTPLLLLAACAPPTDAGRATTLPVDWGEEGSRLVAWGVAGVFVSDAAGAVFSPLTTDPPGGVAAAADTVTTWSAEGARVFHLADGGAATSQAFGCDADEWLGHALFDGERTWGVCDGDDRAGRLLRAGADGAALDTAVPADRVVADQGAFYLALDYGREGTDVAPVDRVSLAALREPVLLGGTPGVRGDTYFSSSGELGNSDHGGVTVESWSDPASAWRLDLAAGEFANDFDVLAGRVALIDVLAFPSGARSGRLVDASGHVLDTLPACPSPRLVARGEQVEGWCVDPLRRYTWAPGDDGWERVDEHPFDLDVHTVLVLEPGD